MLLKGVDMEIVFDLLGTRSFCSGRGQGFLVNRVLRMGILVWLKMGMGSGTSVARLAPLRHGAVCVCVSIYIYIYNICFYYIGKW